MDRRELNDLLALAAHQHGLVAVRQAAELGISMRTIRAAAERGWLIPVRRGVYAVAGLPPSRWRQVAAAALAAGPDAVISHRSAATIHRFDGIVADRPELTVPGNRNCRLDGVKVHRSLTLPSADIEHRGGLSLTTPIRTVIDLAAGTPAPLLGRILDEGAISRLWTAEQVAARLAEIADHRLAGTRMLDELLTLRMGEGFPHSYLEQRVIRVLRPKVPPFRVHHTVVLDGVPIELDIAWPLEKIDGEVDGMAVRAASRTKFERQCRRENILAAHGWRIVHFTAQMDDETMVAQVLRLFGAR